MLINIISYHLITFQKSMCSIYQSDARASMQTDKNEKYIFDFFSDKTIDPDYNKHPVTVLFSLLSPLYNL